MKVNALAKESDDLSGSMVIVERVLSTLVAVTLSLSWDQGNPSLLAKEASV